MGMPGEKYLNTYNPDYNVDREVLTEKLGQLEKAEAEVKHLKSVAEERCQTIARLSREVAELDAGNAELHAENERLRQEVAKYQALGNKSYLTCLCEYADKMADLLDEQREEMESVVGNPWSDDDDLKKLRRKHDRARVRLLRRLVKEAMESARKWLEEAGQ